MMSLSFALKPLLLPPMSLFILAAAGFAISRRRRVLGRSLIALAAVLLYLLSTPLVADSFLRTLETAPPLADPGSTYGAGAIVVLGAGVERNAPEYGGETADALSLTRVRYAAKLHRADNLPVLVSGGQVRDETPVGRFMAKILTDEMGTPVTWLDDSSRNTFENAVYSARMLRQAGISRVLLVTHAWHMPRAQWSFEANGIDVVPAPTGFTWRPDGKFRDFIAGAGSLYESAYAIHEWVGRLWYRLAY